MKFALDSFAVFSLCLVQLAGASDDWSYDPDSPIGPSHWGQNFSFCNGQFQSPIDILTDDVTVRDYDPLVFHGYDIDGVNPGRVVSITNTGHSASISLDGYFGLSGGGLPTEYEALQAHLHWGSTDDVGSEHKIDGKQYPIGMHIVHYAADWYNSTFDDALNSENHEALAVLGVLFEIGEEDNPNLEELITGVSNIVYQAEKYVFQNQIPLRSLLPEDTSLFYRYNGSLTTPACFEVVTWTVFKDPVKISLKQLQTFRQLREGTDKESSHVAGNTFRPTQDIGSRDVYYSSAPATVQTVIMLAVFIAVLQCINFLT